METQRLFEWLDGPLVRAMQEGGMLLVDEISLTDDSVLERLNSVLEPERRLLLAEKGSGLDQDKVEEVVATETFRIFATMNPGGDYGKKEVIYYMLFHISYNMVLFFEFAQKCFTGVLCQNWSFCALDLCIMFKSSTFNEIFIISFPVLIVIS